MRGVAREPAGEVESACLGLIRDAIRLAKAEIEAATVPEAKVKVTIRYLARVEPGRHSGREFDVVEPDVGGVLLSIRNALTTRIAWRRAEMAVDRYIKSKGIKPSGFSLHDVPTQYLGPLLSAYLGHAKALRFERRAARSCVRGLIRHLTAPVITVKALIALENFSGARPFSLGPGLHVHPIRDDEIRLLGRDDLFLGPWNYERLWPKNDWWICEVLLPNPRGTAEGWNRVYEIVDRLLLALRCFKAGFMAAGMVISTTRDGYGRFGTTRGGRLQRTAGSGEPYALSESEVRRFITLWKRLEKVMAKPTHFLQLPARRLQSAGARTNREDALVDYVIGLEALLGTSDERTELGYRFRVRGAVIMSSAPKGRREAMRELARLYDLRSRIVHGESVRQQTLDQALPFAEEAL